MNQIIESRFQRALDRLLVGQSQFVVTTGSRLTMDMVIREAGMGSVIHKAEFARCRERLQSEIDAHNLNAT